MGRRRLRLPGRRAVLGALAALFLGPPLLLGFALLLLQIGPLRARGLGALVAAINGSGALRGALSIGALEGDLLGGLRLRDVALRDGEGQVAIAARQVDLRYDLRGLRGLLRRRLEVAALGVSGATVRARHLGGKPLNLAALATPRPPVPGDEGAALTIAVREVRIDGELRYEGRPGALPGGGAIQAAVRLAGAVEVAGATLAASLATATVEVTAPLRARLRARGDLRSGAEGALWVHGLRLEIETSGEDLDRLRRPSPGAAFGLRGPFRAALEVDGPGAALDAALRLRPPRGAIDLTARVDVPALLRGDPIAWRGALKVEGVDAAAACRGAPRTDLQAEATLEGSARAARIDLGRLALQAGGASALLRGSATTAGALEAWLTVSAPDLSTVGAELPVPPGLGGRLSADVHLRRQPGGPLRARGTLRGTALAVAGASVTEVALDLDTEDIDRGAAHLLARGVRGAAGPTGSPGSIDELSLDLKGSRRDAQLALTARSAGAVLALAARATPRHGRSADELVGFDATLDRLELGARGRTLRLEAPARIELQRGQLVAVHGLALGAGAQRLRIDGDYDLRAGEVRVRADAERLDLGAIAALLLPGQPVPETSLTARVRLTGPLAAPLVDVEVRGTSAAVAPLGLGAGQHLLVARSYRDGLWSELTSTFEPGRAGAAAPRVSLRADVPYAREAPLFGKLLFERLPLGPLRQLLPPSAAVLAGEASLEVLAEGSRAQPQLSATLTVPRLAVGALHDGRGQARLRYDGADLLVAVSAEVGPPGRPAGRLALQLQAPLGPVLALRPPARRAALLSVPIAATLTLGAVDLRRLPLRELGLRTPPQAGVLDGTVEISGTARAPSLAGRLAARGVILASPAAGAPPLDADLRLRYQEGLARIEVSLDQRPPRGAARPLLRAEGEAPLPLAVLLGPGPTAAALAEMPIHLDLRLPGYDLSALEATEGRVSGRLKLRGTLGHPEGEATLVLERLRFDERAVGDLRLDLGGAFDGAAAAVRIGLRQGQGGALQLTARVPIDGDRPLEATLRAQRLDLSALPAFLPQIETLEARLDGELRAAGTRRQPQITGSLRVEDGTLRLDGSPFAYRRVGLEVKSADGRELVLRAQARSQGGSMADRIALLARGAKEGSLLATAHLSLDGGVLRRIDGTLEASRFPLAAAGTSAWLDSKAHLLLSRDGPVLAGTLAVDEGSLQVTRSEAQEQVARAQPLRDIVFVDAEAVARRREAAAAAAEAAAAPPIGTTLRLRARLPEPFYLRGPEVDAELSGGVDVELGGGQLKLLGSLLAARGWIELSGQRYTLVRAGASFDGSADLDPALDVRLEREIKSARLIISVRGRASAPVLALSAEPPVYDESQLMAMIVAGGSGDDDAGRVTEQRVLSAVSNTVSSAILGQVKKRLGAYLPIEVLKLDLGFQGVTRVTPRLEVGKYITRRIYLSYVYQFGGQAGARRSNTHEAHLDLSILRNLSLVTLFGDAAVGAVKLYWTRRF